MAGNSDFTWSVEQREFNALLVPEVSKRVQGRVRLDVPASTITTMAVGGPVRAIITVESVSELQGVLSLLSAEHQSVYPFGFGSNIVVGDSGLVGWGVRLGASFKGVDRLNDRDVKLGGAGSLMSISRKLSEEGLAGLEFASGIPASVGGAVFMNAGAHGGELGSRIQSVTLALPDGRVAVLDGNEMKWDYRSSGIAHGAVVVEATVSLVPGAAGEIAERCAKNLAYRRATQPLALPSAGSVFKNPSPEIAAGMLLEQAGMKGVSKGGASISTLHANWIVNPLKNASANDVIELMQLCCAQVQERSGVRLSPELRVWS